MNNKEEYKQFADETDADLVDRRISQASINNQSTVRSQSKYSINFQQQSQKFNLKHHQYSIFKELTESGIDPKNTLFIIISSGSSTKQEAMDLLASNEHGMWQHYFLPESIQPQPGQEQYCRICLGPRSKHIMNSKEDVAESTKIFQFIEQQTQSQQIGELALFINNAYIKKEMCLICLQQFPITDFFKTEQINHLICIECLKQYLTEQIIQAKVEQMKCPHCEMYITVEYIREYVDPATYMKFVLFLRNNQVNNNPLQKWCPTPNCGNIIQLKSENEQEGFCQCCLIKICAKCGRIFHQGLTCQNVLDNEIQDLTQSRDIQRCQKCKTLVQKISGCNHMKCQICKYQWCWLCGSTYTEIHYLPFNPFGCPMLQDEHFTIKNTSKYKLCLWRFIVLVILIISLPFIILLSCPSYIIYKFSSWIGQKRFSNKFFYLTSYFFGVLGCLIIGIILEPLAIIIQLILVIPVIIYLIYYSIEGRLVVSRIAEQRLRDREQEIPNNLTLISL